MTKNINRYNINELTTLRIRKKGYGKTVELSSDTILQASDGDEFNDTRILKDFQDFQDVIKRLKGKKDFEIEFDFEA
jgi:hypothetical protein